VLFRSSLSLVPLIIQALTYDFTPPLFYIAAHFSMLAFGETATAIRIPSAIFGILLIPIMYYIGKEYKDELFGILAAGFTTIFYNAVFYSRYGRAYAMELMFFSITFYFFMRLLKGDNKSGIWFGIFALCSLWTHLYSAIPIGMMMLYLLWERKAYAGIMVIVIGSIPLLNYIQLILVDRCSDMTNCFYSATGTNSFGATPQEILFFTPVDIVAYSSIIIFPIIVWVLWKHRKERLMQIISVIALVTWGSMFIVSLKTPVILHYSIFLIPMLLLPLLLPFYEQIKKEEPNYTWMFVAFTISMLEATQIFFIWTIQRGLN